MPDSLIFILFGAFFVFGLCGVVFVAVFALRYGIRGALRKAKRQPIRELEEGAVVKVEGVVSADAPLLAAPLSGRKCVCYQLQVTESRDKRRSITISRERKAVSFIVQDETGKVLIETSRFSSLLHLSFSASSNVIQAPTERLERFLDERAVDKTNSLGFRRSFDYREGAVEIGSRVAVMGKARLETDHEPKSLSSDYRTAPKRWVLDAKDDGPLLISNDPLVL